MIFKQTKQEDKFHYFVEDLFGEIELVSKQELDNKILDSIVFKILSQRTPSGIVQLENGEVGYFYKHNESWQDDE